MYLCRAEDKGDNKVPMYKEKSLARRQKGTQTVYLCRVEDEFMQRREPHSGSPSPITKPTSPADPSPVRPALQPPPTMIQSTVMSTTRG